MNTDEAAIEKVLLVAPVADGIVSMQIHRPEVRNALSSSSPLIHSITSDSTVPPS